jgi:hypothetical protein
MISSKKQRPDRGRSKTWAPQPCAHQGIDLCFVELVGESLDEVWLLARGDAVVQGLVGDAPLGELALEPFVAPRDTSIRRG